MPHTDQSAEVARAKADLLAQGADLNGPCGALSIVNLTAWRLRGSGAGLLFKIDGNQCRERAVDILMYPDGEIYDVLIDAGGANRPAWQEKGTAAPDRWRPPTPVLGPPVPPNDLAEAVRAEFRRIRAAIDAAETALLAQLL